MKGIINYDGGRNKLSRGGFFDNFFNDLEGFNDLGVPGYFGSKNPIKVDIKDNGTEFLIEAEIPGAKKEDIKLKLEEDILTLEVHKEEEKKEEKDNYIKRERYTGSYSRSFHLSNIIEDSAEAKYEDGVLKITIKKGEEKEDKSKTIEIK